LRDHCHRAFIAGGLAGRGAAIEFVGNERQGRGLPIQKRAKRLDTSQSLFCAWFADVVVAFFALWMWTKASRGRMAELEKRTKRYPTDLNDEGWEIIDPFLPPPPQRGRRPPTDLREALNAPRYPACSGSGCCRRTFRPGTLRGGSGVLFAGCCCADA